MKLLGVMLGLLMISEVARAAILETESQLLQSVRQACEKKDAAELLAVGGTFQKSPRYLNIISYLFRTREIKAVRLTPVNWAEFQAIYARQSAQSPFIIVTNPAVTVCIQIDWQPLPAKWTDPLLLYFGEKNGRFVQMMPASSRFKHPEAPFADFPKTGYWGGLTGMPNTSHFSGEPAINFAIASAITAAKSPFRVVAPSEPPACFNVSKPDVRENSVAVVSP